MEQLLLFPDFVPDDGSPPLLIPREQRELLEMLLHGGSPQVACGRLGLRAESFSRTLADDKTFARRLAAVHGIMTQNVIATIYAAALKGTPAAQSLWLKTFPPPPNTNVNVRNESDELDSVTDRQLRDWLALQSGDLPWDADLEQ